MATTPFPRVSGGASLAAGQELIPLTVVGVGPAAIASHEVPDDSACIVVARVAARDDTGLDHNAYERMALVYRTGGGPAMLGAFGSTASFTDEGALPWDVAITVSGNNVEVEVTGEVGRTTQWAGTVSIVCT